MQTTYAFLDGERNVLPRAWFYALGDDSPSRLYTALDRWRGFRNSLHSLEVIAPPTVFAPGRTSSRLLSVVAGFPVGPDQMIVVALRRFHQSMPEALLPVPRLGSLRSFVHAVCLPALLRHISCVTGLLDISSAMAAIMAVTAAQHATRAQRTSLLVAFVGALCPRGAGSARPSTPPWSGRSSVRAGRPGFSNREVLPASPTLGSLSGPTPALKKPRRSLALPLTLLDKAYVEQQLCPLWWFYLPAVDGSLDRVTAAARSLAQALHGAGRPQPSPLVLEGPSTGSSLATPSLPCSTDTALALAVVRHTQLGFVAPTWLSPSAGALPHLGTSFLFSCLFHRLFVEINLFSLADSVTLMLSCTALHRWTHLLRYPLLCALAALLPVAEGTHSAGQPASRTRPASPGPSSAVPRPARVRRVDETASANATGASPGATSVCGTLDDPDGPLLEEPTASDAEEEDAPPAESADSGGASASAAMGLAAAAAVAGTAAVSRSRYRDLLTERRTQQRANRSEHRTAHAAAAGELASQVHPRPEVPASATVPAWASDFHASHALWHVGGWVFCTSCGSRHSGKGSKAPAEQCPRDLASKSTQKYLTGVLKSGRQPKQLTFGNQWPDGVDARASPLRAVRRLSHSEDTWTFAFDGDVPPPS